MKQILYLTFYYEPDLCAGSFRNTPLVKELAKQLGSTGNINVFTTFPNRYQSFATESLGEETDGNIHVTRIKISSHNSGFIDQIKSFKEYFFAVKKATAHRKYDLVVASSSRLFTAYLGYSIARKKGIPLYLDIRDIFVDTISDVLPNKIVKTAILPILKKVEKKTFSYASHINLISEGFKPYFKKYNNAVYTYFTNGIDGEFILSDDDPDNIRKDTGRRTITYAGNIGEGQGLHKIIPPLALKLGSGYFFRIIGAGGMLNELKAELLRQNIQNVSVENPVKRAEVIDVYRKSDFIFIHLNDYAAFEKVLPSKVFEAGAFPRPLLVGVRGYAREFINRYIDNVILFAPGNADEAYSKLISYSYRSGVRRDFVNKFRREAINEAMAGSIIQYLA